MRAVLPHTALQLVVSSSGLARQQPGFGHGEEPFLSEECVWPAAMIGVTPTYPRTLILLAQKCPPFVSFDAVAQRRQHALRPDLAVYPRPVSGRFRRDLFSLLRHCHHFAFAFARSVFHVSTFLSPFPRLGFAFRASPAPVRALGRVCSPALGLRFPSASPWLVWRPCGTTQTLTPAAVTCDDRSPRLSHTHFPTFRLQPRDAPRHRFTRQ